MLLLAAFLLCTGTVQAQAPAAIHGFVREAESGEPISLANVNVEGGPTTLSGRDGYFSMVRLAPGEYRISLHALGFAPLDTVVHTSPTPIEIRLHRAPLELPGVTARASRALDRPFEAPEVSVRTVTPAEIRRVPAALEADLFRSVQALPGIVSPGVLSSRLLVRGGAADQNLYLLDGYPVLQPYHLGGGFSAFHTEAVRDAELWIGAPPARYGGALSSVLDISLREGNRERTTGTATVGLVTSAAVVEGGHPAGAWFVGARRTYLDMAGRAAGQRLPYYFYDAYAKGYADLGSSDRVSALVFFGQDRIYNAYQRELQHFDWSNAVYGLSWRHLIAGRAGWEQRVSLSRYGQELRGGYSGLHAARIATDHTRSLLQARGDLWWDAAARHRVEAGYLAQREAGRHRVGYVHGIDYRESTERATADVGTLFAAYVQDDLTVSNRLRLRLGLRGEVAAGHRSLQPRFAAKFLFSDRLALTAGGGLLRQYAQLLQDPDVNFDVYSVDIVASAWEPRTPAGSALHLVGGVEVRLPGMLHLRAETYTKEFNGLLVLAPYDPIDQRFAIERLEPASGRARGVDLSLAREAPGPIRGWVGYSLASSRRSVDGESFAADAQPRQRFVAVWEARTGRRWGLTGRFEAFEGIPFTPAVAMVPDRSFDFEVGHFSDLCRPGWFQYATNVHYLYGARNSARTGWSKRLDLGTSRGWTDRRGWRWEIALSVLNALFDPTGVFRPGPQHEQNGCEAPDEVQREYEFFLPPIPSVGLRVEF